MKPKYFYYDLHQGALALSYLTGIIVASLIPNVSVMKDFLGIIEYNLCKYYYFEEMLCAKDKYYTFVVNFMSGSISLLTSIYTYLIIACGYYCLKNIPINSYAGRIDQISYKPLLQLLGGIWAISLFWGKGGLSYFDAVIVAAVNTTAVWMIYDFILRSIFLIIYYMNKENTL